MRRYGAPETYLTLNCSGNGANVILTDASLPKIGERLGGRDHTTVLHAVEKIAKLMREDRDMYTRVQRLTAKLKSAH